MSLLDRIRLHKPFEQKIFEGYPAYVKRYRWAEMMWVEKEDGLHKYRNGEPSHSFGATPMVFEKCSWKWLSQLSQIKADIDGFWRHDRWWDREVNNFIYGRKVNEIALSYLKDVGSVCGL